MATLIPLVLLAILVQATNNQAPPEWSYYGQNGPANWCTIGYKDCCGSSQSPINIDTKKTSSLATNLYYENYDTPPLTMQLTNDGRTVDLTISAQKKFLPRISRGPFSSGVYYYLDAIHFHWGSKNTVGSEHTIDDRDYPMEMHMVHYNSKYANASEASKKSDGLAVIGVLYYTSSDDTNSYNNLTKYFPNIKYKDQVKSIPTFAISNLMPKYPSDYYTYKGSLTTPPCTESVTWLVFKREMPIGTNQLKSFRSLQEFSANTKNNVAIQDNYRPVQDLNNRSVKFWKDK